MDKLRLDRQKSNKEMKQTNDFVLFWGGIYSQWFLAEMEIDGVKYNCCEQYMMHQKALLFGDTDTADKILAEPNQAEQKKLGREVKGFNDKVWIANCLSIVYKGNVAKFEQHDNLREELLATGNKFFVEASPKDQIWGIGLGEDEIEANDPATWKGTNLLGQALTLVRIKLAKK